MSTPSATQSAARANRTDPLRAALRQKLLRLARHEDDAAKVLLPPPSCRQEIARTA